MAVLSVSRMVARYRVFQSRWSRRGENAEIMGQLQKQNESKPVGCRSMGVLSHKAQVQPSHISVTEPRSRLECDAHCGAVRCSNESPRSSSGAPTYAPGTEVRRRGFVRQCR